MKKIFFLLVVNFFFLLGFSQNSEDKDVFVFTITDYIQNTNDSVSIVQVQMPNGFSIDQKQMGLLKRNYNNNKEDTGRLGYGRCHLIKGDYYYFGLSIDSKTKKPQENDLLYTKLYYGAKYKGLIYGLTKNAIYFSNLNDSVFYNFSSALWMNEQGEEELINAFVNDIQFTAKAMEEQIPDQNKRIEGGIFNGIRLFTGMKTCTAKEVKLFIEYVIALPPKYAGNTWKISETFATWMDSKTPTVIK